MIFHNINNISIIAALASKNKIKKSYQHQTFEWLCMWLIYVNRLVTVQQEQVMQLKSWID